MNKKDILIAGINHLIKEELKHYDKVQFKHVKEQKPEKIEKERMATEEKVEDKKTKFLEALTSFVHEYNTKRKCQLPTEELLEELAELGKMANVKKDVIKKNLETYKRRPKIYAFEVVEMFVDKDEEADEPTKTELKKADPERAPEPKTIGDKHPDAHWRVKDDAPASANKAKDESAPDKPKGVKEMPTKAKTTKGIKLMEFVTESSGLPLQKITDLALDVWASNDNLYNDIDKDDLRHAIKSFYANHYDGSTNIKEVKTDLYIFLRGWNE